MQRLRGPFALQRIQRRSRQGLLLPQRAEQAIGLDAAAAGGQRLGAQAQPAWRQRLCCRDIQREQGLAGATQGERLAGALQRACRRMAITEGLQVRIGGRFIAPRQRSACGLRARQRFGVATVGGLRQQLFGAGVVAAAVGGETVGQLRSGLPRAMAPPGAEGQAQQGPRQRHAQHRARDQAEGDGNGRLIVRPTEAHQHVTGVLQQDLRKQRAEYGEHQPEQHAAEQGHRASLRLPDQRCREHRSGDASAV